MSAILHAGANIDGIDSCLQTACHNAVRSSDLASLRWLVEAGADVTVSDLEQQTPLHCAARFELKDDRCTVLLMVAGADVNAADDRGVTPFLLNLRKYHETGSPGLFYTFVAAGADLDTVIPPFASFGVGRTVRQLAHEHGVHIDPHRVELARKRLAKARLDIVRRRAFQVCVGLQSLRVNALQMCEILQFSCRPIAVASSVPFHIWWAIATAVKHFRD